LLIALIMLVTMTLAGLGMMRSVDTGSVIAGNLAFKQATLNATDAGINAGYNVLMTMGNSNSGDAVLDSQNKAVLNFNSGQLCPSDSATGTTVWANVAGCVANGNIAAVGYSSTPLLACEVTGTCAAAADTWWQVAANWAAAPSITVSDPASGGTMATVQYLIHRMCATPNEGPTDTLPVAQVCHTYTAPATGCSKTQITPCTSTQVIYRITARSVGVRNTASYTQAQVMIGQ
jgi:Tfp pilus assembly protein PilX